MLRNSSRRYLLSNLNAQKRLLHQNDILYSKSINNTSIHRQGKIMGKLFGNRVTGSKKRWFPATSAGSNVDISTVIFKQSQFGNSQNRGDGKNSTRRMTVLNKLFMKHITDLLATGEISENLLGKGLQVSRVKISQDFAYVNVFWLSTGDVGKDVMLEHELQRCSGLVRHELSQLGLMGVVPRIKFVKDKLFSNINQVEALLKNIDFGADEEDNEEGIDYLEQANDVVKQEFYGNKTVETSHTRAIAVDENSEVESIAADLKLPEMRHDVLGLDHKEIMLKLLTKMRKSKQAWEQHQHQTSSTDNILEDQVTTPNTPRLSQLNRINNKLAKDAENSQKFDEFLAKRRERKNVPERKKYRAADHVFAGAAADESHDQEVILSARQEQYYYAEDYLHEQGDNPKS